MLAEMREAKCRKAGGWLVWLAVLGYCVAEPQSRGQGVEAAAPARHAALQLPGPSGPGGVEPVAQRHRRQHHTAKSIHANVLVHATGPDRSIRHQVQRAMAGHLLRYSSGGFSVEQLAGAEAVGDVGALATLSDLNPDDLDSVGGGVRLLSSLHGHDTVTSCPVLACCSAAADLPSALVPVPVNACECSAWVRFPSMEMLCPSTAFRVRATMKM